MYKTTDKGCSPGNNTTFVCLLSGCRKEVYKIYIKQLFCPAIGNEAFKSHVLNLVRDMIDTLRDRPMYIPRQ
jgi:hypothetical protein